MRVINHHFVGGDIYLKEFWIDENESVPQHVHEFDHTTLLTHGIVALDKRVLSEGEVSDVRSIHHAPDYIFIERGVAHTFMALNGPAKGYCTHITDCHDVNVIDKELTVETDT